MADLYLDSDVTRHLAGALSAGGHPTRSARDEGKEDARDYEQLWHAAQRGWTIITHNKRDFRLLHGAWQTWSAGWGITDPHSGILIMEQAPMEVLAAALLPFLATDIHLSNLLHEWTYARGWTLSRPPR